MSLEGILNVSESRIHGILNYFISVYFVCVLYASHSGSGTGYSLLGKFLNAIQLPWVADWANRSRCALLAINSGNFLYYSLLLFLIGSLFYFMPEYVDYMPTRLLPPSAFSVALFWSALTDLFAPGSLCNLYSALVMLSFVIVCVSKLFSNQKEGLGVSLLAPVAFVLIVLYSFLAIPAWISQEYTAAQNQRARED